MHSVTTKVWDPLLRAAHWGLVGAFSLAYLSEEELLSVHVYAGYSVLAIVVFRAVWGFIGPSPARFVDLLCPWPAVRAHLVSLARLAPGRYLGHTPAGGWMVVFLLFALLATTLSGVAVQEDVMFSASALGVEWEEFEFLEELHEFFANLTLLLVGFHLVGVVIESFLTRENLPKAMVTGRKRSG
jgi:cytochrome b